MIQFYKNPEQDWSEDEFAAVDAPSVDLEVHIGEEAGIVYFVLRSYHNKPLYKMKVDVEDVYKFMALVMTWCGPEEEAPTDEVDGCST